MAAAWPGGVPVVATPWGSDADRIDVPAAAHRVPTALARPVPHYYNLPLALGIPLPQTAGVPRNGQDNDDSGERGAERAAGLSSAFTGEYVSRGPPMPPELAAMNLPFFLPLLIPRIQHLLWHACRRVCLNVVGKAKRITVAEAVPAALAVAIVEWFVEHFAITRSSDGLRKPVVAWEGNKKVHSVLLTAKDVKKLCCFQSVDKNGMGLEHVRVVSCQGDLRFVRSLCIRSAQSGGSNARGCVARLEIEMTTWEVNGRSLHVTTGSQLPFTAAQWAVCVMEAKRTVATWPADKASTHLTPQLQAWKFAPVVLPLAGQSGSSNRGRRLA